MNFALAAGIILTIIVVAMSIVMIVYGSVITQDNIPDLASPKEVLITFGSIGLASCIAFWIYTGITNANDIKHALMMNAKPTSPLDSYLDHSLNAYNNAKATETSQFLSGHVR